MRRAGGVSCSLGMLLGILLAATVARADWNNGGGDAGRNGRTSAAGPDAASERWSTAASSIIAWQPVIEGNRVFMVRQTGFPPGGEPNGSPIFAYNVATGGFMWRRDIPFNSGDWTTWIAGVKDGKVYASRSGNGASVSARLYCLDVATGLDVWISQDNIDAGAYDGVVFASNGDPIIGSFTTIKRIRASDGTTAWTAPRVGSVSGNCGVAINEAAAGGGGGGAVYAADVVPGGHVIKRFNLATGAFQYQSPVLPGFTLQQSPTVSPDGTVYLARTQNNPSVDQFYAFDDSGSALTIRWQVNCGWSTSSEFGVASDGSAYMRGVGNVIERRAATNGAVINSSLPLTVDSNNSTWRFAVDGAGKVYLNNGSFANGRLYAFNADLTPRWSVAVPNINIGGPAIASDGTLIVCGVGTNVKAYFTAHSCVGDIAPPGGNGVINVDDLLAVIVSWGSCPRPCPPHCPADIAPQPNGDCMVNVDDLLYVITHWGPCP